MPSDIRLLDRDFQGPVRPPRVLIVDDDPTTLGVLGWALEADGFQVVVTADSSSVLEQLERKPFDAVVMDLVMPGLSGWQVLEDLHSQEAQQDLPVLLISSEADAEVRVRGLEAGAEEVLTKPVDSAELAVRLRRAIARSRVPRAALSGDLADHDLREILQYLAQGRKSGLLEVDGNLGRGGCELARGQLKDAWLEDLSGRAAALALLELSTGSFRLLADSPARQTAHPRGLHFDSVESLVMTAAWLQDELANRRSDLPGADEPLASNGEPVEIPTELAIVPIAAVWEHFLDRAGATLGDLLATLPYSPAQLRLAVAWLCHRGRLHRVSMSSMA